MSLINEALKRAKDVQQQTPAAADGPALRPVDPAEAKSGSRAKTLLFVMVVAVITGNVLLWLAFKDRNAEQVGTAPVSAPAATQPDAAAPVTSVPTAPAAIPTATAATPEPVEIPAVATPEAAAVVAATNAPEPEPKVVFVEPPKPTELRLQSIIYSSRPSAMIAGKFLFVGDSIQGHRVIAIDRQTVTLVGGGQTNVLSLP